MQPLIDRHQTGREMRALVGRYKKDLHRVTVRRGWRNVPVSELSMSEIHKYVRDIPYRADTRPVEVVARPARILNGYDFPRGVDCKKKAVILAAWAACRGLPWRFVAMSSRPDKKFHHVFPQIFFQGIWVNMDATYKNMRPGADKRGTAFDVI